jgi:glycosyltransferase involved in cell wall biosynthesis
MIYINGRFLTQRITGVQRFAYELTNELIKINNNIIILIPNSKINTSYDIKGWNCKKIWFSKGYFWEQISLPLYLLFHESRLLLCLCNLSPVFYKNKITVIHDLAVIEYPEWFNWKFSFFYKVILPLTLRTSKMVLTVSDFSKQKIIQYYPFVNNIQIVNNAISDRLIEKSQIANSSTTFNKLTEKKYILCVSSLDPRKNLISIVKAFESLELSDIELLIVGGSNSLFQVNNFFTNNKNIRFLGYVCDEELFQLYKNSICFVYLSLYEGFGIPPLEAMALGCPVLLSDIPVHRELFAEAALLVNPVDISMITKKLLLLLNDDNMRRNLIYKGLLLAKKFSWQESAKKVSDIIYYNIN